MARVLLTGSRGKIGRVVSRVLRDAGVEVVGFDIADGNDVLDRSALASQIAGCKAVVHLAAVIDEGAPNLMETNVIGTWNVLTAAQNSRVERVIFMSSVNALGIFLGHRKPDYLPIDDQHPAYAYRPYSLSKRVGEQMCEATSRLTDLTTICLRPPAVLEPHDYERLRARRAGNPESEWDPFWEYGAFLDIRDCAAAVERSLRANFHGHTTLLLCAADISATRPTKLMVQQLLPNVPWRGGTAYVADPYKALVDTTAACEMLGWRPSFRWRGENK